MVTRLEVKSGEKYGRLVVVEEVAPIYVRRFECLCECGQTVVVRLNHLRHSVTKSCGCLRRETAAKNVRESATTHGQSGTQLHSVWKAMRRRCYNPNSKGYDRYGGRGVQVCQQWRDSFEAFLNDMGRRPSQKHSIDRIDNTGHYSCGHCDECVRNGWEFNCRWATAKEQCRNTRTNRMLTHDGKTMCVVEWSEETGISQKVLRRRLKLGWTTEDALTTPVGGKR